MPTSTQPNGSPSDKPKKSKLEREIEEILQRVEKENPLPPPTPIRSRRRREDVARDFRMPQVGESLRRWLDTAPLLVAFMAAIVGVMIKDFSPFLATIAAVGAVVALFWPVVASFRAPRTGPKMWRGREYESRPDPPQSVVRLQEWLRKKGILK
jgi:hypothetical protein